MRRLLTVTLVVAVAAGASVVAAAPAAAKPKRLTAGQKDKARDRVAESWEECLALVGIDRADIDAAKVRRTSAAKTGRPVDAASRKPVLVTLPTGEAFIVHLKPGLKGAATGNEQAEATLDAATAAGGDCGGVPAGTFERVVAAVQGQYADCLAALGNPTPEPVGEVDEVMEVRFGPALFLVNVTLPDDPVVVPEEGC